jgi:AcrR family transcriptional regulator
MVLDGLPAIRNEPVQARSTARLAALLDAAAAAVDELGYERLTTAMVAERAGASIGTVYRYFPDRIAVLQALGARNFERVSERVRLELLRESHNDWAEAMAGVFDVIVDAFRNEPSFRSLRVGDVIDLRPPSTPYTFNSRMAKVILDTLHSRFGTTVTEDTQLSLEGAIEASDALISRAFSRVDAGDPVFLAQAKDLVHMLMQRHLNHKG